MKRLADRDRFPLPKAETLIQKVEGVDLDLEFETEEETRRPLLESKAVKTWQTLRIASRSNLSGFDKVQNGTGLNGLVSGAGKVPGSRKDDSQEIEGGDETTHPAAT
jgi:THO complex subunit 1